MRLGTSRRHEDGGTTVWRRTVTARTLGVIGLTMVVLVGSACGGGGRTAAAPLVPLLSLRGYVSLRGPEFLSGGPGECYGAGPYKTLQAGLSVSLIDHAGRPLRTAQLAPGTGSNILNGQLTECLFYFQVLSFGRSPSYTLKIGNLLTEPYTYAGLTAAQWQVTIPLGHLGKGTAPPSQPIPLL